MTHLPFLTELPDPLIRSVCNLQRVTAFLIWTLSSSGPTASEPISCSTRLSWTMSSSAPVQQGDVVVVTQMYPTPSQGGVVCNHIPQQMSTGTSTFSRVHPIALGTVQIMIGLMVFSFGVVTAAADPSLAVYSGFFVWGAGIYITAGSLTVAAGKSSNSCQMNTTLDFNIIATLFAGFATILYTSDALVMLSFSFSSYECYKSRILRQSVNGLLAVFHVLEFIITIVVSAFLCKSTCDCCKPQQQQQPVYIIPGNTPMAPQAQASYSAPATVVQFPLQGLPTYPAASTSMAHPPTQVMNVSNPAAGQSSPGFTDPPQYSEEIKGF